MADDRKEGEKVYGEEAIIQRYLAPLAAGFPGAFGLQDDCALISPPPGTELVLKTDPVAEGVHFVAGDAPEDIAWKALAVNVSDLAAKGAQPIAYLMALSFPEAPAAAWLSRFAEGLQEAQKCFGCHLAGGDTDRRPGPLTVTITVIGSVEQGRMVPRGAARAGDALFVSGTLGDAALGLLQHNDEARAQSWALTLAEAEHLRIRYARPQPRLALAGALRQHAHAAMDLSDGLAKDLGRLCAASGCAARVRFATIPLSEAAAKALAADPALTERIVAGGDDYEILAAVPADKARAFVADAAAAGVPVAEIGRVKAGSGVTIDGADGLPMSLSRTGWDHF
ncbi:MAG: thiamine-phosphate kinase [Hyphomicrobiaceae bacterium]|nr:MAG: thiamine-phosphate kinase [Hyphomicrobiaceae bacterium]